LGQGSVKAAQQFATALKDARQTSTELALSALYPNGAGRAAAGDAGLSTSDGGLGNLASGNLGGAAVRPRAVTLRPTSRLGDLSMRHETGYSPGHEGKAAGVVSGGAKDPGGVSYGAYQLASSEAGGRQVQAFLKSPEGARWADRFKGLDPTQPGGAFAQEWKKIAANEPDKFFTAQHDYIKRTHYDPVVQEVRHATSLDINQRSRALKMSFGPCLSSTVGQQAL